jgi:hypothetical protein
MERLKPKITIFYARENDTPVIRRGQPEEIMTCFILNMLSLKYEIQLKVFSKQLRPVEDIMAIDTDLPNLIVVLVEAQRWCYCSTPSTQYSLAWTRCC